MGSLLGIIFCMPFWIFEFIGTLFDNQRSVLTGNLFNVALAVESPTGFMLHQLALVWFVMAGGLLWASAFLTESFVLWPPMSWWPTFGPKQFQGFIALVNHTMTFFALYAFPLVFTLMLVDFLFSLVSLTSEKMPVYEFSAPIRSITGLFFLTLYIAILYKSMQKELLNFQASGAMFLEWLAK